MFSMQFILFLWITWVALLDALKIYDFYDLHSNAKETDWPAIIREAVFTVTVFPIQASDLALTLLYSTIQIAMQLIVNQMNHDLHEMIAERENSSKVINVLIWVANYADISNAMLICF